MRISVSDVFAKTTSQKGINTPRIGSGILVDLDAWLAHYGQHLIITAKSKTTIANYDVTLKAFREFVVKYHANLSGIDMVASCINNFLEWMEDYRVSRIHGSIEERVNVLLGFLDRGDIHLSNYKEQATIYLCELKDDVIDTAEFVIMGYYDHLIKSGDNAEISAESIRDYIAQRKRASNATMEQRRIALIAFLKYIDKTTKKNIFEGDIHTIRNYPIAKHAHKSHQALDDEMNKKLDDYLATIIMKLTALGRELHWKEYCTLRTAAMITLMKGAGLRASEARTLKFSDIEESKDGRTFRLNILGKGNKKGRVPIRADLLAPFLTLLSKNKKGEYLSSGYNGKPMDRSNLYVSVGSFFKKVGVPHRGLHLLRHTFGSSFASKNGNIKILQQILRHSNITTTMIYSNVNDGAMADAIAAI